MIRANMLPDRAGADLAKAPWTPFVCNESDSETRGDYYECAGDYGFYSCARAHCHARKELVPQPFPQPQRGPLRSSEAAFCCALFFFTSSVDTFLFF